jgi:hypothetical protein
MAFLLACTLQLAAPSQLAGASTTVPLMPEADWTGYANRYPSESAGQYFPATNERRAVFVLRQLAKENMSPSALARHAYDLVFKTKLTDQIPPGPAYLAIIIYMPKNTYGLFPLSAFVFLADKNHRWQKRYVTAEQLQQVQGALGQHVM